MTSAAATPTPQRLALLESRFAMRVASALGDAADATGPDVAERLRFAREQALERARVARTAQSDTVLRSGAAAVLGGAGSWGVKLAALLPLAALIGGLALIHEWHIGKQVSAAAEIDAALLADDLPPGAYSDPGFVEFLKTPPRAPQRD